MTERTRLVNEIIDEEERNYEDSLVVGQEVSFHDPDNKLIAFNEVEDHNERTRSKIE